METTDNDAAIAQILAEEYETEWKERQNRKRLQSDSSDLTKRVKREVHVQIDEDFELAVQLFIEELVRSENHLNQQTDNITDDQLEKTHATMVQALQSTNQENLAIRIFGIFTTIQTRFTDCQNKNQILIDQIKKLSIQYAPILLAYKTQGICGITKATVPAFALGLLTDVLQGKTDMKDAKDLLTNVLQIWNDSSIWLEFFEQIIYILIAVTITTFTQGIWTKLFQQTTPVQ